MSRQYSLLLCIVRGGSRQRKTDIIHGSEAAPQENFQECLKRSMFISNGVDRTGFEPVTSCMPCKRATSCANGPFKNARTSI